MHKNKTNLNDFKKEIKNLYSFFQTTLKQESNKIIYILYAQSLLIKHFLIFS